MSGASYFINQAISEKQYKGLKEFDFEQPLTRLIWIASILCITTSFGMSWLLISDLPDIGNYIRTGRFAPIRAWMTDRVHQYGSRYTGDYKFLLWDFEGMYQFGQHANQTTSAGAADMGTGLRRIS